ncbi:15170_t:CDS:2, partial [Racocetra fulgida]
ALRRLQVEKYGKQIALILIIKTCWGSAFEYIDYLLQTKMVIKSILSEDNIRIDSHIQILIINDNFWKDFKHLYDLLKPFLIFIHLLEQDNPLLSVAYIKLLDIRADIHNNQQDHVIEKEIIWLYGIENKDKVLLEFAEYVSKTDWPLSISDLKKSEAIIDKKISENMINNEEADTNENFEENIEENFEKYLEKNFTENSKENLKEQFDKENSENSEKYSEENFEEYYESNFISLDNDY